MTLRILLCLAMIGGAKAWCEMTADLDIAREDFKW